MKILLAITTYNELDITNQCLQSAIKSDADIDILIVDDYSEKENIKALSQNYPIYFIGKVTHTGLTHSWNLAYRYFIENNYDILFISNNDVLIPTQTLSLLSKKLLESDALVVVPSSTFTGAGIGKCGIAQGIKQLQYHPNIDVNLSENFQKVQDILVDSRYQQIHRTDFFNGFT